MFWMNVLPYPEGPDWERPCPCGSSSGQGTSFPFGTIFSSKSTRWTGSMNRNWWSSMVPFSADWTSLEEADKLKNQCWVMLRGVEGVWSRSLDRYSNLTLPAEVPMEVGRPSPEEEDWEATRLTWASIKSWPGRPLSSAGLMTAKMALSSTPEEESDFS